MEEEIDGETRHGIEMNTAKDTTDAIDRRDAVVDGDMKIATGAKNRDN